MSVKLGCRVTFIIVLSLIISGLAQAAPLAPNDASINDNLCLWLKNPELNYDPDAGIWTDLSGKANDARTDVDGFVGPTLSLGENPAVFSRSFSAVRFEADVADMLRATNLNNGQGLNELTIFVVVNTSTTHSNSRPVGFGSYQANDTADNFNPAGDVSIRKDNGNVQGATATHPLDMFMIRVARMNPDGINQWFNADGTLALVHDVAGSSYTTGTDNFYLGDLRVNGAQSGTIEIAEVVVFNTALTDVQIEGVSEWLQANVGSGGGNPLSSRPNPANGSLYENTWASLSWKAGYYAVSHDLYFGTVFDDVNDGVEGTFFGNLSVASQVVGFPTFPAPEGLQPGTTYYWRVDEVNDANVASPWKGKVWSFSIPPRIAHNNIPADGEINVLQDVTLNWTAGFGSGLHQVYFGDNPDDVNNAAGAVMQDYTTYTPVTLEVSKTYYWRVDEFDAAGATHKGDVWSFTTVPDIVVTNPNLKLWWTLDERAGTTVLDRSGHGNHGTISDGANWADGYQGTALTFREDVYVEAAGYDGIIGTAARTFCAWIRTTTANRNIISWGQNAAGQKWRVKLQNTGGLRIEVNNGSHYGVTNVADGLWHHVAVTFEDDGTPDVLDTILYVDGQRDATAASADEPIDTAAGPVRIGESPWHNAPFLDEIDDVRIYDKALTAEEIRQIMLGDTKLAGNPDPQRNAIVDIRKTTSLNWSAGDAAASHDVYFGADRDAVATATGDAPEFQGNQVGTSLSLAGMIEFGGGDYYWRVDEVEADGTAPAGTIWKFTIPDYLVVEDFEIYDVNNNEIWWSWKDGLGYPARPGIPAYPGNGTGSAVGDETSPTYMEMSIVHGGAKSMPMWYTNNNPIGAKYSEVELTLPVGERDWTIEGIGELSLWFRGETTNAPEPLYVAIAGTAVVYHDDPNATQVGSWTEWVIPLQDFAALGVNLANVDRIALGVGTRGNATIPGTMGKMYFDDILLSRPPEETAPQP